MNKKGLITSLCLMCIQNVFSQFSIVPIPNNSTSNLINNRIQETQLASIELPFWDDFSFSTSAFYPHDTLWEHSRSIWVNYSMGIAPPSLGVATFDGLDSLGNPYRTDNALEKGIADRLTSAPLKLNLIPIAERTSVMLSFYYQYQGNGEPPDTGDNLQILFKNDQDIWNLVHTIENTGALNPKTFVQVMIPVTESTYFHETFQFRIQNYGRLSGPYDTWNIDYVYLNSGRSGTDTSYPDRTISTPLSSLFHDYRSIPIHHFIENPTANLTHPLLSLHNLEFIPGNTTKEDHHPLNYSTESTLTLYRNGVPVHYNKMLDNAAFFGVLTPLEFSSKPITTIPSLSELSIGDSIANIKLKLWINTNDNVVNLNTNPPGDYDPDKYAPINFRNNDTTQITFDLANYYAYDDGSAEYGAILNQPGAQLAYLFEMKTLQPDTLKKINMYFPMFGTNTTQSIEIQILQDLKGNPESVLHKETVTLQRNTLNQFWTHELGQPIIVQNKFYIGWKQNSTASVIIGLDKNTNSGDKIFFNINGTWEQNTDLLGSLMIRPIFEKGESIITTTQEEKRKTTPARPFPNPNNGLFIVGKGVKQIQVLDLNGKTLNSTTKETQQGIQVKIHNTRSGLYIVRFMYSEKTYTYRIMVK